MWKTRFRCCACGYFSFRKPWYLRAAHSPGCTFVFGLYRCRTLVRARTSTLRISTVFCFSDPFLLPSPFSSFLLPPLSFLQPVSLRLARMGIRHRPFYRIVAAHKEFKRDGRFLDRWVFSATHAQHTQHTRALIYLASRVRETGAVSGSLCPSPPRVSPRSLCVSPYFPFRQPPSLSFSVAVAMSAFLHDGFGHLFRVAWLISARLDLVPPAALGLFHRRPAH